MKPVSAQLSTQSSCSGDYLCLVLEGDWTTRSLLPSVDVVEQAIAGAPANLRGLTFNADRLGSWNSGLMTFVVRCWALCQKHQLEFQAETLPGGVAALLRLSQAVPEKKDAARQEKRAPWLEQIGQSVVATWEGGLGTLRFLGENVLALLRLFRGQAQFRWRDVWLVMEECGPRALGIVALINFLIGLILAFVGATQLAVFGAGIYTADLVAVATVREMGCIMTGIIMCGRTGAAFAAQLGTMKVNQEIEAFQTFAIDPIEFLVLPRVLALVFMMPLLVLFADAIAIAGGFMASTLILQITPEVYWERTLEAITLKSFLLGVFKGGYFGIVIALTGCLRGMQCGSNAAAVGLATTSAVVTGITAIIASDGLFAVLCTALGI